MSGEKAKILIIDDRPSEVKMVKMALERADYKLIYACDGEEGVEKAKQERPDLIILDIMMPEKDGFQTADELRNDLDCCMIPIILLTAFGEFSSPLQDIKGPFVFHVWDEYLKKPIDPNILLCHVEKIVARKEGVKYRKN